MERPWDLRVEGLIDRHRRLWQEASVAWPELGPPSGAWRRFRHARATRRLIADLAGRVEAYPDDREEIETWSGGLRERVLSFGERRFGWPASYRNLSFGDDLWTVGADFVRRARRFDRALSIDELGQAMRNVWIVNSLQMLFGEPVELTPPVFAYSLLYPYTDNLLDDPALGREAKRGMNERLGRWLVGERVEPRGRRERRIHRLVGVIEAHFPRARFADVYESLLAIHHGQIGSLRLQGGDGPPDRDAILAAQIEKGGASVLADGYLVRGRLAPEEEDFCFGYGVFLQLLDDLQDAVPDREAGHQTLFSIDAGKRALDPLVSRLWSYMRRVVEAACCCGGAAADGKDLILRNCTMLMVSAVADRPELVSRRFRRALERRWPVSFRAMRSLRRFAERRFRRARAAVERRKGVASLWDLI